MTEKERYEVLLSELAELLKQKNDTIYFDKIRIENLEKKLKEAEHHLCPTSKLEIRNN